MWKKDKKRIRLLKGIEGISDYTRDILENRPKFIQPHQ